MKKILIILLIVFIFTTGCQNQNKEIIKEQENSNIGDSSMEEVDKIMKNNFVSYHGNLKLDGTDIVNQYGEKIQLRGMSSHGIQWYNHYINEENIKILKEEWNSNVFRLAMYTAENGYLSNKNLLDTLLEDIDMIIQNDLYVIIDWHILSDGNPYTHLEEAKVFFDTISSKYKNTPNIIYEVCNEPNGNISWSNDIKPYATEVIKTIRKNSNNIIIVGTNTWCQDVLDPINDKIEEENIMYSAHFYSGTHTEWLRNRVQEALNNGIPIFVSEWGTSDASGDGGVFLEEAEKWIQFMKEKNISWTNWSFSDKNETSALLKNGTHANGFTDSDLTESGQFVKKAMIGNE